MSTDMHTHKQMGAIINLFERHAWSLCVCVYVSLQLCLCVLNAKSTQLSAQFASLRDLCLSQVTATKHDLQIQPTVMAFTAHPVYAAYMRTEKWHTH